MIGRFFITAVWLSHIRENGKFILEMKIFFGNSIKIISWLFTLEWLSIDLEVQRKFFDEPAFIQTYEFLKLSWYNNMTF